MKPIEKIVLKYFLEEYPEKTSYRVILEIVRGQRMGWVKVWAPFEDFDSHVLVGLMTTLKNSLEDHFTPKK